MMLAQRLYEAGYITYMRTDSTNLSREAVESARGLIQAQFGQDYLPAEAEYTSKKALRKRMKQSGLLMFRSKVPF